MELIEQPNLFNQPEWKSHFDKITVHPNSIDVYKEKILPTLSGRKKEVFEAIKSLGGSADLWEVSQYLNRPVHTISGRFSEMKKLELIEDTKVNKKHGNSEYTIWRVK